MLGLPHRDLDEIAGAIADGLPIDWPADPADVDGYESRVLNNLKIVAQIAALHASPSFLSSMTSGSLGTIDERRAADDESRERAFAFAAVGGASRILASFAVGGIDDAGHEPQVPHVVASLERDLLDLVLGDQA